MSHEPSFMKLANALHYTLELFHRNLFGNVRRRASSVERHSPDARRPTYDARLSLESLLAHFEARWNYSSGKFDRGQHEEGKAILERYYRSHGGEFPQPVLLEERFKFGIGPYSLSGKLDRVDRIEGGYEIIDYKTPREIPEEMDTLQLDIYQLGFHVLTQKVAGRLSFYYLRQGEKRSVERGGENIRNTQERLCRVAWQMGSDEKLEPRAGGHCRACDFTCYCPDRTVDPLPGPAGLASSP